MKGHKQQQARQRLSHRPLIDRCQWCSRKIVWHDRIPKQDVLQEWNHPDGALPGHIKFRHEGNILNLPYATVDHVLERYKGGTNDPENLVPACRRCNAKRTDTKHLEPTYTVCKRCDRQMPESTKQTCKECKAKARCQIGMLNS